VRVRVVRFEAQRLFVLPDGVLRSSHLLQDEPEIVVCLGIMRVQLQRRGTLAISATELMSPAWDWLRACHEPVARVGYTMFIYRLADADTEERWEQTLRVNPNDARAHYNLGIVMERAGDAEGAITHYVQAIRIQPDFAMAHDNLAMALQRAGKVVDAVDHYVQVARIEPDNV